MRKTITVLIAAALGLGLLPGTAGAGKPKQSLEGNVAIGAQHTDGSCYPGVQRRVQAVTQSANGVFGYDFDVDKKTWNKKFVMELTGATGTVDLDITYYLGERTKLEDFATGPGDPAPPATIAFQTREEGGEAGTVPKGAVFAIVCAFESENSLGGLADFTYTAG